MAGRIGTTDMIRTIVTTMIATTVSAAICPHCAGDVRLVPAAEVAVVDFSHTKLGWPLDGVERPGQPVSAGSKFAAASEAKSDGSKPAATGTGGEWTLRECFETWMRARIARDRAKSTLSGYYTALGHWENYCQRVLDCLSSARFDVGRIGYAELAEFREYLRSDPPAGAGQSVQSVRRIESCLRPILREAKKRGHRGDVPELDHLRMPRGRPLFASIDEVQRLLDHCHVADWPVLGDLPPSFFWRTILSLYWVYGARTRDFVDCAGGGLAWSSVHFSPRCPDAALRLEHAGGWLEWMANKTRNSVGLPLLVPLHPEIGRLLREFRGIDSRLVFRVPRNSKAFHSRFGRIRAAAGLDEKLVISGDGRGNQRSIRKGCAQNWDDLELGFGAIVLGHEPHGTHNRHYLQAIPKICARIGQLRMPDLSFKCDRQLRFF